MESAEIRCLGRFRMVSMTKLVALKDIIVHSLIHSCAVVMTFDQVVATGLEDCHELIIYILSCTDLFLMST